MEDLRLPLLRQCISCKHNSFVILAFRRTKILVIELDMVAENSFLDGGGRKHV